MTGVSNVAYDLMVVLTNKLEGVAAMEEYKLDADAANDAAVRAAFERIEQRERQRHRGAARAADRRTCSGSSSTDARSSRHEGE